jgi:hypothetical protein
MLGVGHQFQSPGAGADPVPGQDNRNTSNALGAAWNGGQFNASGFYNQSDVSSTAVSTTTFKHKSYAIGGNAGVGPMVRIYGGWFHYTAEQPAPFGNRSDNGWTLSGRLAPTSRYDFELGYAHFKANNAGAQPSGGVVVMRNPYANTSAITAVQTGTKGTLYASAFYHFDRSTEIYVVADRMNTKDGWADPRSFGASSQTEYGVGIRTRF